MIPIIKRLEKNIVLALVILMTVILLLSTVELAWIIITDVMTPPVMLLDINELLDIFGLFMLVLIGIELLETIIKTYMSKTTDHTHIVMDVAIIAIARKVIILDVKELPGLTLVGLAAIILALTAGHFLIRHRRASVREVETASSPPPAG